MREPAAAVVVALVVLTSGCGGGGGERLSRDAYVAKADAICRDVDSRQRALAAPASIAEIPGYVGKALPILDDGLERVGGLRPPSDLQAAVTAWLRTLGQARDLLSDLRQAAEQGDAAKVRTLGAEGSTLTDRSHTLARSIGLTDCANA